MILISFHYVASKFQWVCTLKEGEKILKYFGRSCPFTQGQKGMKISGEGALFYFQMGEDRSGNYFEAHIKPGSYIGNLACSSILWVDFGLRETLQGAPTYLLRICQYHHWRIAVARVIASIGNLFLRASWITLLILCNNFLLASGESTD